MKLFSKIKKQPQTVAQNKDDLNHPTPELTPYQLIGGEQGVRDLVNRFYDIMEQRQEAKELAALHPHPMESIRERFFEYLSGWMGGPPLFENKYGHPRLRARHLPYAIDSQMRNQWMWCMDRALNDTVSNPALRTGLRNAFAQLAQHMINQAD